jgi:hypothetical protein
MHARLRRGEAWQSRETTRRRVRQLKWQAAHDRAANGGSASGPPPARQGKDGVETKPERHTYNDEEVEAALTALALEAGNLRKALRLLKASGKRAPDRHTLGTWARDTHADRYRRLQQEVLPALNARLAQQHDDIVDSANALTRDALAKAHARLDQMKPAEQARAAKDASVTAGIHSEKSLLRRGQPTVIRELRNPVDLMKAINTKYPGVLKRVLPENVEIAEERGGEADAQDQPRPIQNVEPGEPGRAHKGAEASDPEDE